MPNKGPRGEITFQFFLVGDFDNDSDVFPFIILSSESLSFVCYNLGPINNEIANPSLRRVEHC
jgi:hypothetical protein